MRVSQERVCFGTKVPDIIWLINSALKGGVNGALHAVSVACIIFPRIIIGIFDMNKVYS
jgi:hypothetical protein